MPALVNADSTRLIQISTLALSNLGKSTFRGISRKSDGWGVGSVAGAVVAVCISLTASNDCETADSVAAFTVASTKALMDAGSIAAAVVAVVEVKKASSFGVGEGDGVRAARFLIRVCGEGNL